MTIVDANVLLYAYNADAPQQRAAAQWLTKLFASGEMVGLPWVTLWTFIRIATNSRVWDNPLSSQRAFAIVAEWLALPNVVVAEPGPRHLELLQRLVVDHKAAGRLTMDAVLAAMALENGAALASSDRNFGRFSGLRWVNPLDAGG